MDQVNALHSCDVFHCDFAFLRWHAHPATLRVHCPLCLVYDFCGPGRITNKDQGGTRREPSPLVPLGSCQWSIWFLGSCWLALSDLSKTNRQSTSHWTLLAAHDLRTPSETALRWCKGQDPPYNWKEAQEGEAAQKQAGKRQEELDRRKGVWR